MIKGFFSRLWDECGQIFTVRRILCILLGTAICSFGIYNIHRQTGVTEGGVLGMIVLLNYWFDISPSILSVSLDILCYVLAFRRLGLKFLIISGASSLSLSIFFRIWESFPPMLPNFYDRPLIAAFLGALFIGVGVGVVIRNGGSCSGDDALALFISNVTGWRISRTYLITDFTVLALSLSYIPFKRIFYSLITVTLSSYIIDLIQRTNHSSAEV
ncbi:MAG: YitT family protein [Clostridia bacterium]|nr:YitT family protein [Clostridia bacterium]